MALSEASTQPWEMSTQSRDAPPFNGWTTPKQSTWEKTYSVFLTAVPWAAVLFNGISFMVFVYKMKTSKKESYIGLLLAGLAVTDTLATINAMDFSIFKWSGRKFSLLQHTSFGCNCIQYISGIARDCSCYFILLFTVDRFLSVQYPVEKTVWVTKKRVQIAMATVVLCSFVAECYRPYSFEYNKIRNWCQIVRPKIFSLGAAAVTSTLGFALPGILVAILNCLIIRALAKWRKKRATVTVNTESQNHGLTVLLMAISTFSFLVSLPQAIFWYQKAYIDQKGGMRKRDFTFASLTDALANLNYTCNFFFYCLSGSQFRGDMLYILGRVFTCGKSKSGHLKLPLGMLSSYTIVCATCNRTH